MAETVIMQKIKPFYLSIKAALLGALVVIFLQGCGAKGDLYHTPEPTTSETASPEKVSPEELEKEKKTNKQDVSEQQTK